MAFFLVFYLFLFVYLQKHFFPFFSSILLWIFTPTTLELKIVLQNKKK